MIRFTTALKNALSVGTDEATAITPAFSSATTAEYAISTTEIITLITVKSASLTLFLRGAAAKAVIIATSDHNANASRITPAMIFSLLSPRNANTLSPAPRYKVSIILILYIENEQKSTVYQTLLISRTETAVISSRSPLATRAEAASIV